MAKLFFRYGTMNSGKSTALMQVAYNYEERGMRVLVAKPAIDTKAGSEVSSRLGIGRRTDLLITPDMDVVAAVEADIAQKGPLACLLIDEAQFLQPKQVEELLLITVEKNIPVICYGLRSDFATAGFPGSTRLLELAHKVEEMKTICACGRKAMFNGRKVNGKYVFEGDQVAIDTVDNVEYEALCAACYLREKRTYYKNHPELEAAKGFGGNT